MYIPLDPCEAQTLAVHCSFNAESTDWITLLGHYLMIAVLGYCCGLWDEMAKPYHGFCIRTLSPWCHPP